MNQHSATFSMDPSRKLIYARNHDLLSGNLQAISDPSSYLVHGWQPSPRLNQGNIRYIMNSLA